MFKKSFTKLHAALVGAFALTAASPSFAAFDTAALATAIGDATTAVTAVGVLIIAGPVAAKLVIRMVRGVAR